jgi:hypothetical protein
MTSIAGASSFCCRVKKSAKPKYLETNESKADEAPALLRRTTTSLQQTKESGPKGVMFLRVAMATMIIMATGGGLLMVLLPLSAVPMASLILRIVMVGSYFAVVVNLWACLYASQDNKNFLQADSAGIMQEV